MNTRRRSLAVIGAVLLAGCTSSTARVPALAARAQSPDQRERDTARCDDIRACTGQVASARPSSPDVVVGRIGSVAGGDSTQVRPHSPRSEALERSYTTCPSGRGYSAAPAETPR